VFGTLAGGSHATVGWIDFREQLARELDDRRARLEGLALTLSAGLDGDVYFSFTDAADMVRPEYRRAAKWLELGVNGGRVDWAGTATRDHDGHWSYVIDSNEESPFPVGYPIFDGVRPRERAWTEDRVVFVAGLEDEFGRWDTAYAPIHTGGGVVVGLVEVVLNSDTRRLDIETRTRSVLLNSVLGFIASFLVAVVFARWLNRHLSTLIDTAEAVAAGDLNVRARIRSSDELGVLGAAFDAMVDGLVEREHIRETLGRFVHPEVAAELLSGPEALTLGGSARTVTVLMSDLRGFTALSERLGPEGMVSLLNRYFSFMSEVIDAHHGTLSELLGDGMVVLFGAPNTFDDDARRAVRCAVDLQRALRDFNASEAYQLEMGVGIDTGPVVVGNVGSQSRMKYGVVGDAINLAARLESATIGNQVLISQATLDAAGAQSIALGQPQDLLFKGRSASVRCFAVRAIDGVTLPSDQRRRTVLTQLTTVGWPLNDKRVSDDRFDAVVCALCLPELLLRTDADLHPHDRLKLTVRVGDRDLEDLYATTVDREEDGAWRLRLTSVPLDAQAVLDAIVATTV